MRSMRWTAVTVAVVMGGVSPRTVVAQGGVDAEARAAMEIARSAMDGARPALEMARADLLGGRPELEAMRVSLEMARIEMEAARPEMEMGLAALEGAQLREPRRQERPQSQERPRIALPSLGDETPPEGWLQEDPGSRLYQDAREALNRRRFSEAAELFAQIREDFPRSGYVADSYYWQAFSLYREGGQRNYRRALELLDVQLEQHAGASTASDARSLSVRIEAQLARRGDADAAEEIARRAAGPCDEEQEVRMAALSALMNMNAEQAVPILREVLQSRDECSVELRKRAVFMIAQHMSDESVDILLDLAHRNPDPDREVREQAVFWLHQVDTPEALDALQSILEESEDEELQERAIFAISQRSDARSVQILKDYAERSDAPRELRENAIFWIGQSSGAGGAEYLMQLYQRLDDDELRERAIFGIAQTNSDEGRRWLLERVRDRGETVDVRKNALFWAGQMGGLEADDLDGLYGTLDDREMKEQVIFVASQMRGSESVDFLMELATNERDKELRERAIFWLGQSNDPRVAEFLLTLIRGGRIAR